MITVFRLSNDVFMYVTGNHEENEMILLSVLTALFDCLTALMRFKLNSHFCRDLFFSCSQRNQQEVFAG